MSHTHTQTSPRASHQLTMEIRVLTEVPSVLHNLVSHHFQYLSSMHLPQATLKTLFSLDYVRYSFALGPFALLLFCLQYSSQIFLCLYTYSILIATQLSLSQKILTFLYKISYLKQQFYSVLQPLIYLILFFLHSILFTTHADLEILFICLVICPARCDHRSFSVLIICFFIHNISPAHSRCSINKH